MGAQPVPKLLSLRDSPHYMQVLAIFVVTSFVAIFTTTSVLSQYLANYMTTNMMMRDAVVSMEFLNSIVRVEEADPNSFGMSRISDPAGDAETREFFTHVSRLPDVFRANIYSASGEVLWSSDPELIGRTFEDNDELEAALVGKLDPEIVVVDREGKEEHVGFPTDVQEFIEFYIPIWSDDDSTVIGAVEVYKAPEALLDTIHGVVTLAWVGALMAGTVLFTALLAVVVYATRILRRQEQRLVETERLAVVGEMASAVAHGLRNPLAAIRSCAELVAEDDIPGDSRTAIHDIMDQVDRLETWIRSFLTRTRAAPDSAGDIAHVDVIIQRCLAGFEPQLRKRGIAVELAQSQGSPVASAGSAELEQVLNTILSNAIEAMKAGGVLRIGWHAAPGGRIAIEVADTGPGLSDEQMARLFVPFQTSKSSGLGVGLALGRRIAERLGGSLDLKNRPETGVEVTLTVPARA
ncbi:sensor histidine kinase [Silicimonas algicola]|uniref:histidine kinase n=1 Tax=Silicimonas algicola TaxID=1826607 RepID=A0A316G1A1_9RHOB|nr:ATP-binding protein [Silicimonas algicola]PWK54629.1 phospho-acceptor domain-containing protein [Silicimonas algicola]